MPNYIGRPVENIYYHWRRNSAKCVQATAISEIAKTVKGNNINNANRNRNEEFIDNNDNDRNNDYEENHYNEKLIKTAMVAKMTTPGPMVVKWIKK